MLSGMDPAAEALAGEPRKKSGAAAAAPAAAAWLANPKPHDDTPEPGSPASLRALLIAIGQNLQKTRRRARQPRTPRRHRQPGQPRRTRTAKGTRTMQPLEVLAIVALRQWQRDRSALRNGKTTNYRRGGYRERRQRDADAVIVRALDFERALSTLPATQQAALLLTYRSGASRGEIARALACSNRTAHTLLDAARARLARTLDRLDLL